MADKLVLKNAVVKVNNATLNGEDGVDISDYVRSVTVNGTIPEVDTTAMGDDAQHADPGIEDNSLALELYEGREAELTNILWPLRGTKVFISARLKSAAAGSGNPSYRGLALIAGAFAVGGGVGAASTMSLTWRIVTAWTRATA